MREYHIVCKTDDLLGVRTLTSSFDEGVIDTELAVLAEALGDKNPYIKLEVDLHEQDLRIISGLRYNMQHDDCTDAELLVIYHDGSVIKTACSVYSKGAYFKTVEMLDEVLKNLKLPLEENSGKIIVSLIRTQDNKDHFLVNKGLPVDEYNDFMSKLDKVIDGVKSKADKYKLYTNGRSREEQGLPIQTLEELLNSNYNLEDIFYGAVTRAALVMQLKSNPTNLKGVEYTLHNGDIFGKFEVSSYDILLTIIDKMKIKLENSKDYKWLLNSIHYALFNAYKRDRLLLD